MSGQYSHEGCTFFEVQRFRQVWIWVVVIFIAALAWYAFIRQIVFKQSFGNNPAPDWAVFILLAIFGVIFPALFLMMRLEIFVTGQRLVFRMFPLHPRWKEVAAAEIEGAMAIVYRPFREYGGWGIRYGRQGIAYTVSGDRGVLVRLSSGRTFLIGSRRPLELETALQDLIADSRRTSPPGS